MHKCMAKTYLDNITINLDLCLKHTKIIYVPYIYLTLYLLNTYIITLLFLRKKS